MLKPCANCVALYVRASTEHQNYSTSHQEAALRDYAAERNFDIVGVYRDEGRSGLTLDGRAGLLALFAPGVMFRNMAGAAPLTIPVTDGHAFEDQTMGIYKVAIYRFADWPRDGVVLTPVKPVAIGTIYE